MREAASEDIPSSSLAALEVDRECAASVRPARRISRTVELFGQYHLVLLRLLILTVVVVVAVMSISLVVTLHIARRALALCAVCDRSYVYVTRCWACCGGWSSVRLLPCTLPS